MNAIIFLLVTSASAQTRNDEPAVSEKIGRQPNDSERGAGKVSSNELTRRGPGEADYRLGAGDTVEIVVHGEGGEAFGQTSYVVDGSGRVSFPYVGQVDVAGMTAFETEREIQKRLQDGFIHNPEVTVQVTSFNSQRVDVLGAVNQPGVYSLEGPTTLRALLAKAGGIATDQSNGHVTITRGDETKRVLMAELDTSAGNFMLQSGDLVEVDPGVNIFMAGEVANPGAVPYDEGLTASQALLLAGGGTDYSRLSGSYVVRGGERIRVNLKRVLRGKDADVQLSPGDRVVVPTSAL